MTRVLFSFLFSFLVVWGFAEQREAKEEFVFSTPGQVGALSHEPSYLIGGLISPLSGQPALRQTDLVAKGAQNIILSRIYIAPNIPCHFPKHESRQGQWDKYHLAEHVFANYKGWQSFPHLKLQFNPHSREVAVIDPSGVTLKYKIEGKITELASPDYAISNTAGDTPSGKFDPRNTQIFYDESKAEVRVLGADGTTRVYLQERYELNGNYLYLLHKEILSSGKVLKYDCKDCGQFVHLISIKSLDPKERFIYASIQAEGSPWLEERSHYVSSSGASADYHYERRFASVEFKEKDEHWYGDNKSKSYHRFHFPPVLQSVSSPFYREENLEYSNQFLLKKYQGKDQIFIPHYASFGEGAQSYRVSQLSLPVGEGDEFKAVYEMDYNPPIPGEREGVTRVKSSDGTSTLYHFSKKLLTTKIQYFSEEGDLKKEKCFSWDERNWLESIEMKDGQGSTLYKRSYEFDAYGNPVIEVFTGNLSGEGNEESYIVRREFSQDGRNLLFKESHQNGKVISFSYLPNTNLITAKIIQDDGQIILREFWEYDDCNNLIQKISDDGNTPDKRNLSEVTQRTITNYILRQEAPFLHMPEWIEEKYQESGSENLLRKMHLTYDQYGNVSQEDVYDANGEFAYTIHREYNERGDLLSETNPLGQRAAYSYDEKGRLITSTNFSERLNTSRVYDAKGRVLEQKEHGDDGIIHAHCYKYDAHDRLIEKVDPFTNITRYTHDPIAGQIVQTDYPSIVSADGEELSVSTSSTYDSFGRELTKTDANGHTKAYHYNAYGSVTEIVYSDGAKESFLYAKNGDLTRYTDPDGLITVYTRDVLGRVLAQIYTDKSGAKVAEERFTYKGQNLVKEIDKEGNVTRYFYDGSGRKIQEKFCGRIIDFKYDSLGRLSTVCKHNRDNTLFIRYERDLEGRVLEERKEDLSGQCLYKISYSYDADGNRATTTRYIQGKEAVRAFVYDSMGRVVGYRDAERHATTKVYDEDVINNLGQKVLQIRTKNPLGVTTIVTKDALGQIAEKEKRSPTGAILSSEARLYDPVGNLRFQVDHVYSHGAQQSTQTVQYAYTSENQLSSYTRALGTPDERTTSYTYFPSGKRKTKTSPSGITLAYRYQPLGFLAHIESSDGQIDYRFEHDRLGNLIFTSDEKKGIAVHREVDASGNVLKETLPSGLEVEREYDRFNRVISLNFRKHGKVLYTYDPLYLRKVERLSNQGDSLYVHTYEKYDLSGGLVAENLIGDLEQVHYERDLLGRQVEVASTYFPQQYSYDAVGNLQNSLIENTENHYVYDELSQLSLEEGQSRYSYDHDSLHRRIRKNGQEHQINDLNELLSTGDLDCSCDLNGNLTRKQSSSKTVDFTYDPLNRLVKAASEDYEATFAYDPLGRLLSKTKSTSSFWGWNEDTEFYIYDGDEEIGSVDESNQLKSLKVLGNHVSGLSHPIALELNERVLVPLIDIQGSICRLVDPNTKEIEGHYDFTAFGEELQVTETTSFNPWRFASKRLDSDLGIVNFGKRFYDPELGRWLTTDPAGSIDSMNLYQYALNNPFRYVDKDGQFVIAIPLIWGVITLTEVAFAVGAPIAAAAITWAGYELVNQLNNIDWQNIKSPSYSCVPMYGYGSPYSYASSSSMSKTTDVYAPDRPLPRDERTKEPVPDTDVPHTQLGTKESKRRPGEKYPQSREFDENGKPVKDIDFTDHGTPKKHPNPHQHVHTANATGGTPKRDNAEPVPGWRYK